MQDKASDITDLNYLALVVPEDGTLAVIARGCSTWAPAPEYLDADARADGEEFLPLLYEGVHSADGKLIDVVAWSEDDPARWWLRCDRRVGHSILLGADELERVSWTDLPCFLVSTPAGWRHFQRSPTQLQSICILDLDNVDTRDLFGACFGTIICASSELERRLQARNAACGGTRLNTLINDLE